MSLVSAWRQLLMLTAIDGNNLLTDQWYAVKKYASDKEYYIRSKAHFNFTSRNCARSESELVEWSRSVRLSVAWRSCLGYRQAGCLQLSHRRPPEMCGLQKWLHATSSNSDLTQFRDVNFRTFYALQRRAGALSNAAIRPAWPRRAVPTPARRAADCGSVRART